MNGEAPKRQMSNLQQRIVSAVILAAVVLAVTWLGGLPFRLLAALIGALMFYEWLSMAGSGPAPRDRMVAALFLAVTLVALLSGAPVVAEVAGLAVGVAVVHILERLSGAGRWTAPGLAYAGLSAIALAALRDGDHAGLIAILFLFAVVWATDILAYFVGRAVGGPKLAPAISPGKTWSGAVGGAVGGLLAGIGVGVAASLSAPATLALVALGLSIVSQVGDLFESWVKRRHGVKDSSNLIPGHGGVMDRVDGLVVAAFALFLIGWALGGADNPAQALFAN